MRALGSLAEERLVSYVAVIDPIFAAQCGPRSANRAATKDTKVNYQLACLVG